MKKILLFLGFILVGLITRAQHEDAAIALKLVSENREALGLTDKDLSNSVISSSYYNKYAGTRMVYLQQSYLGLPVLNQLQVLAFRDGKPVSSAGYRIASIDQKVEKVKVVPSVSPEEALKIAFTEKKIPVPAILKAKSAGARLDYGKMGVSHENVTVELMWVPFKEGKEIFLAWQVYVAPTHTSDYWLIRVDAHKGKVIDETNLTVYCNWGGENHQHETKCFVDQPEDKQDNKISVPDNGSSTNIVSTANYLVIPYPFENRLVPGGSPALRTNPWTMAGGNAATLGWHNDGNNDFLNTRGNNVHAQEDRDNNNSTLGVQAPSTTGPDPLNFNYTPVFSIVATQSSPVPNQQFHITNLFYWNNIIHDLSYIYGFDEASGNFQNSNLGRGGTGNDYVIADGQDAAGTNNANFATPPDGQKPRMQMFLWNASPPRDGSADNGIMVHEYGHGISNRLTGGPPSAGCLGNDEQMGEGWSDYFGLMYTQDWASSNLQTGFSTPRGLGLYVLNGNNLFGGSAPGTGIRHIKYCSDFSVNSQVYLTNLPSSPHDRGEIWCATLWDMTWNIINQVGVINPNLFDANAVGGNSIALKLVMEGMKLQPCNPGFISGRDAILQADQILYGGQYSCAIKEAFRRRGMGALASQGSSDNVNDQVPDFSGGVSLVLTQAGMTSVPEGENIVYTNTVSTPCAAINNFTLTDTLPSNVTFVSADAGGTYNATTRVVSFPVNQAAGTTQTYSFTVNVNTGSYFAPATLLNDSVTGTTIPTTWTTTATPASGVWTVSTTQSNSAPNSYYVQNLAVSGDQRLITTNGILLPAASVPKLSFSHRYNTEAGWDGGIVEISTNNGSTWTDLGSKMTVNGYPGILGNNPTNIITSRPAFSGLTTQFNTTVINLASYAGQNIKLRFRFGSDDNTTAPTSPGGWWIDDIKLALEATVDMRSSLFNSSNVRMNFADTTTLILEGNTCNNVALNLQPANQVSCIGGNVTFSVNSTGTTPAFQWQVSTDNGVTYTNIAGATSASYTVSAVTSDMNNNKYRVLIENACPSNIVSEPGTLTISSAPSIISSPSVITVCPGTNATFTVTASGSPLTYQWQVSTDNGTTFTDINGATSATLVVQNADPSMLNHLYRALVFSCEPAGVPSATASILFNEAADIILQPENTSLCPGSNAVFTTEATGTGITYQWQRSVDGGSNYSDINGETSATLTVSSVAVNMNNFRYRALVKSTCTPAGTPTTGATLNVLSPALITSEPRNYNGCINGDATFSVTASGSSLTYRWEKSENGGAFNAITDNSTYSGSTTPTLAVSGLDLNMNGDKFRVIIDGIPCSGATSTIVTLFVNPDPEVILSFDPAGQIAPGIVSKLKTTLTPAGSYTYQWKHNGTVLSGNNASTLDLQPHLYGEYSVMVTSEFGCSSESNIIDIGTIISNQLFVYPNPSTGKFQVRYFSEHNAEVKRNIKIYDSKGALVYRNVFPGSRTYYPMDIDLTSAGSGVYLIELLDNSGTRIATGKAIVN